MLQPDAPRSVQDLQQETQTSSASDVEAPPRPVGVSPESPNPPSSAALLDSLMRMALSVGE